MANESRNGFVVAIDGPDGVGKTTQAKLLVGSLQLQDRAVVSLRHSGGTPIGEELRKVSLSNHPRAPETDLYISLAMHADLAGKVREYKKLGQVVVIDRSPLTMLAYNAYGTDLADKKIALEACEKMFEELNIDLLIFLTAAVELAEKRRSERGVKDYFEGKDRAFHERVSEGYQAGLEFLENHPDLCDKVTVIDSSGSAASVHEQIIQAIETTR